MIQDLKKGKFVYIKSYNQSTVIDNDMNYDNKFIDKISPYLRYNLMVLFFIYYAKKKFGNVNVVENYLSNNTLLKNLGLNFFMIRRLMIYVNYLTGEKISEPMEEGAPIESILKEKKIFFEKGGKNDFSEVYQEFKEKIVNCQKVDFLSLTESSKSHSFVEILNDSLKNNNKLEEVPKISKEEIKKIDKKSIQNIKRIYKTHHFDISNRDIINSDHSYKKDCENYEININDFENKN